MNESSSTGNDSSTKGDLWETAYNKLTDDERSLLETTHTGNGKQRSDVLSDAVSMVKLRKDECVKKQWKVKIRNKTIMLRDVFEKLAVWIDNFVDIADSIVAWQSPQVTLPWSAIRFFLQIGVNDVQTFAAAAECVSSTANIIAYSTIIEQLAHGKSSPSAKSLREALISLYLEVLKYMSKLIFYFSQSTTKRLVKSLVVDKDEIQSWSEPYRGRLKELERLSDAVQHEHVALVVDNLNTMYDEQLQQEMKLKEKLEKLQQPISRMDAKLAKLEDSLDAKARLEILNSISRIPYRLHHKTASSGRLINSGKWLLDKEVFKAWRDDSNNSVLWLHGIPGSGKTKIASLVIDELNKTSHLAYFYCTRSPAEPERGQCSHILGSYVRQLASTAVRGPILEPVRSHYEELLLDGFDGFEDHVWSSEESIEVLVQLSALYPSITFVLDALDEAADSSELMTAFKQIIEQSSTLIKVFISSRDSQEIIRHLQDSPNLYINSYDSASDISRFISEKLDKKPLLDGELPSEVLSLINDKLVEGSQGMFRWAELQIESLRAEKSTEDVIARLGRLPESLEDSYWEIYQQVLRLGQSARHLATLTIQWLLHSQAPLVLGSFASLVSLQHSSKWSPRRILDICANLVVTDPSGHFRFAHLSVREFFENLPTLTRPVQDFEPISAHATLTRVCLSVLQQHDSGQPVKGPWDNRPGRYGQNLTQEDASNVTEADLKAHDDIETYAAKYWLVHVDHCRPLTEQCELSAQIETFLFERETVAPTFKAWCASVRNLGLYLKPEIESVVAEQNPLSLAYWLELPGAHSIVLTDKSIETDALRYAAKYGKQEGLTVLINRLPDLQYYGSLALDFAVKYNQLQIVELLLQRGVIPSRENLWASVSDNSVSVQAGSDKNSNDRSAICASLLDTGMKQRAFTKEDLGPVLSTAVWAGFKSAVRSLVAAGAPTLLTDLYRVIRAGLSEPAIIMIDNGYQTDGCYGAEARSLLHWAIEKKLDQVTTKLLARNVAVNELDDNDETPLHLAARRGTPQIVAQLLQHGADISQSNIWGQTPLQVAGTRLTHKEEILTLLGGWKT